MRYSMRFSLFDAAVLGGRSALAIKMNSQVPLYPRGHNMNDMPASEFAMGVPIVLETTDAVHLMDSRFTSNALKSCAHSEGAGGVTYACAGGSIMTFPHGGNTRAAYAPAMATMGQSP